MFKRLKLAAAVATFALAALPFAASAAPSPCPPSNPDCVVAPRPPSCPPPVQQANGGVCPVRPTPVTP